MIIDLRGPGGPLVSAKLRKEVEPEFGHPGIVHSRVCPWPLRHPSVHPMRKLAFAVMSHQGHAQPLRVSHGGREGSVESVNAVTAL